MDTAGVETVDFNALGGADTVTVNDLTGTDVRTVNMDLAGTLGGAAGDGQADRSPSTEPTATTRSTSAATSVSTVGGLSARVAVQHQEPNDELDVNGLAGSDSDRRRPGWPRTVALNLDGGGGDDADRRRPASRRCVGGDGNDTIDGNGATTSRS